MHKNKKIIVLNHNVRILWEPQFGSNKSYYTRLAEQSDEIENTLVLPAGILLKITDCPSYLDYGVDIWVPCLNGRILEHSECVSVGHNILKYLNSNSLKFESIEEYTNYLSEKIYWDR